jgi:hypothetical protein
MSFGSFQIMWSSEWIVHTAQLRGSGCFETECFAAWSKRNIFGMMTTEGRLSNGFFSKKHIQAFKK